MKTKFFKVLLVLLAISLLIIPAGADSYTASNIKLEAVDAETVNLDSGDDASVQVNIVAKEALTNLVAIEGSWSTKETGTTSYLTLTSISLDAVGENLGTHNYTDTDTGKLLWTDDTSFTGTEITEGGNVLTATYKVSKDTPEGTYIVTFTSTALITGSLTPGFDIDQNETVYEAAITVVREHEWNETTYAGDGITAYTATRTCKHNSEHVETVEATITPNVKTPATCTEMGWTTYNAKFNVDWADDKTQDVQDIEKNMANHSSEEIEYVDKDGDTHTVKHTCCGVTEEPAPHDFTNGDCVCGAVALRVIKKGNTISYTVSGRVVTVTCQYACKVGYLSGGKYVTTNITKVANPDGSYNFTIPAGVSEVLIVVKGDITGDGKFLANDKATINAALSGKISLSVDKLFAGDISGDGKFLANDKAMINAILAGKINLSW